MIILGIETSCDETALSIIESQNGTDITVLADKTLSQIELHKQYGGVFPTMAKREHSRNLIPLLKTVLIEASHKDVRFRIHDLGKEKPESASRRTKCYPQAGGLNALLEREHEMLKQFLEFIPTIEKPPIDAIAVTEGPGLEPCLWTGINLAKALSLVWNVPIVPVNHMEGHIFSALLRRKEKHKTQYTKTKQVPNKTFEISNALPISYELKAISYPALALLISGGHTELVLMKDWFDYKIVGRTRDDAVGEAFDKVARLLGLPYPGGPEISRLAETARRKISTYNLQPKTYNLPRPMIRSNDLDFSFSGLKTAVLYLIKKLQREKGSSRVRDRLRPVSVSPRAQSQIAREFENAVTEVLVAKTRSAIEQYGARTLLIGGGVIANTHIRRSFEELPCKYDRTYMAKGEFLRIPEQNLTTDNALMIAVAGLVRRFRKYGSTKPHKQDIVPKGNATLDEK